MKSTKSNYLFDAFQIWKMLENVLSCGKMPINHILNYENSSFNKLSLSSLPPSIMYSATPKYTEGGIMANQYLKGKMRYKLTIFRKKGGQISKNLFVVGIFWKTNVFRDI